MLRLLRSCDSCSHERRIGIALASRPCGKAMSLLRALSQFRLLANYTAQEVAVFDRYTPRIGPLQLGVSFLLVALGVWAIILLLR